MFFRFDREHEEELYSNDRKFRHDSHRNMEIVMMIFILKDMERIIVGLNKKMTKGHN
jgi:hypothetical protein